MLFLKPPFPGLNQTGLPVYPSSQTDHRPQVRHFLSMTPLAIYSAYCHLDHRSVLPHEVLICLVQPGGQSTSFRHPLTPCHVVCPGILSTHDRASICLSQFSKPHTGRLLHFWVCLLLSPLSVLPVRRDRNGHAYHTDQSLSFPRFPFSYTFF